MTAPVNRNKVGVANVNLALARRADALGRMDSEAAKLRNVGISLDAAVGPSWDRGVWEQYKAATGEYPFNAANKPPGVMEAPAWVKELCGIRLNPAERMGLGQ